jgi:hypothetical protein
MKPMFLPGVESNPKPGPYYDNLLAMQQAGAEYPQIGQSRAAVAAELLGSENLVQGVLRDLESSALEEKEKTVLRFVDKVNHDSPQITAEDMQPLYAVGWRDEAIYFAITVCALFNFPVWASDARCICWARNSRCEWQRPAGYYLIAQNQSGPGLLFCR